MNSYKLRLAAVVKFLQNLAHLLTYPKSLPDGCTYLLYYMMQTRLQVLMGKLLCARRVCLDLYVFLQR